MIYFFLEEGEEFSVFGFSFLFPRTTVEDDGDGDGGGDDDDDDDDSCGTDSNDGVFPFMLACHKIFAFLISPYIKQNWVRNISQ